jgi:hypothetical protein
MVASTKTPVFLICWGRVGVVPSTKREEGAQKIKPI